MCVREKDTVRKQYTERQRDNGMAGDMHNVWGVNDFNRVPFLEKEMTKRTGTWSLVVTLKSKLKTLKCCECKGLKMAQHFNYF